MLITYYNSQYLLNIYYLPDIIGFFSVNYSFILILGVYHYYLHFTVVAFLAVTS